MTIMEKHKRFEYIPREVFNYQGDSVMKNLFLAALLALSSNAFSQSYFILDNGVTLTVDHKGFIYDYSHYTPVNRVTFKGGQYLVEDNNILVTVDEHGSIFRKYELIPKQVLGKGMNYIIGDDASVLTINNQGYSVLTESDEKVKTATKFGGIFFATAEEIFSVTSTGQYVPVKVDGLRTADIVTIGGNYFMTNRGLLYTVSQDGRIISHPQERVGIIVRKGGNYFVDSMGLVYTVARDGSLKLPALPVSLRIQAISKLGANYFMDGAGKLFTVDAEGNIYERWVSYDLKTIRIISL
jgi:hypothetical protein